MADLIVAVIIIAIVGMAARYIYKAKKRGVKCVGCPDSQCCSHVKHSSEAKSCCCDAEHNHHK